MLRPPSISDDDLSLRRTLSALGRRVRRWTTAHRSLTRGGIVALGVGASLVVVGACSFGPLVRARIAKEADRRNLDVVVGRVSPGFFAIDLEDVQVRIRGTDDVQANASSVRVDLTSTFSIDQISLQGGSLRVEGDPDDVALRWRSTRPNGGETEASTSSSHTPISASDWTFSWKLPNGDEVRSTGLRFSRNHDGIRAGFETLDAIRARDELHATRVETELSPELVLRSLHASGLTFEQHANAPDVPSEPAPQPTSNAANAVTPATPARVLSLPDLHALRERIGKAAVLLGKRLPEGSKIDVDGLTVKLDVGGEAVSFGPGPLSSRREGDVLRLSFKSEDIDERERERAATRKAIEPPKREGTPLALDAELPLGSGDVRAQLSGGPVSLALLGVPEGTKGLFDVAHGTMEGKGLLVLSAAGDALTFDGQIALRSVSIKHDKLSSEPLRNVGFTVSARGLLDDRGGLRLDDAELDMGALHVRSHGTATETDEHLALTLALDVAPASCQSLVDSAPQGLLPIVRTTRMDGTFGATANVSFDTRDLDRLTLDYRIDDRCRMIEVPRELSREHFQESFTHRIYHPDGTQGEATTGPGTPDWTPLEDISPFVLAAVLTTEDGAFYKHKGFNHAAIRSSITANLKARRFVRGASTISMQLAKNLFLSREKTLSRKIEEVILTDYLEQAFPKDDMMELYLNVVEFGPDVYGVTQAADYYFGRKPSELDVTESFFLAMLLPSPIRYGKLHEKGTLPDSWSHHLQTLLRIAAKNGKISDVERDVGMNEHVVFLQPGAEKPTSRTPANTRRRDADENDAEWQPVFSP